jgi:acetolactate synthase-1/2/3 large subunit
MSSMTGGAAIVQSLQAHGIHTLFGLPGVQMDGFFNAAFDAGAELRVIASRHEQGAAYMALGYAAATGGVGAYAVVPGPGFLNTTAALSTAYAANARVLCVAGQIPSRQIGRGVGLLHEIPDQLAVMRSLTKWATRLETPESVPAAMAEAFRQMHTGRPRPVGVEMAMDVMAREGEVTPLPAEPDYPRPPVDPDAVERAARLLGNAASPLIFVGGGAMDAGEQVAALAETLQAPVIAARMGRGVLDNRHYLSHTMPMGHRLWAAADVVLGIGTRLQVPQMSWGLDDALKVIRIDIDPEEPARIAAPAVTLAADSRDALNALLPALEKHNRKRPSREAELNALKREVQASYAVLEPQLSFLRVIRESLPEEGIYVDELTQVGYVGRFALPVYRPRTFIASAYQGTLGWGMATAIGVKAARPDTPVLAIAGDGGLMFTLPELAVAVQHKLQVVMLVFNDGAYGNVKRMQKELYDHRVIASDLRNPDFVRVAEAFGAQGLRAEGPEELGAAIRRGFDTPGPTLIEIPVGEMPDPWPHAYPPRLRGRSDGGFEMKLSKDK